MAPTTGGQYHWVSELAPPHLQKYLSYVVGWLCTLGWQVGNAAIAYLAGTIIQGLITLNNPDYVPKQWQGTLIIWAVLTFGVIFNAFFASKLPMIEGIILVLHVLGFFAVLIPLWVLGKPAPAREVFFTFQDGGGWGNQGLSCLVGMLSAVFTFLGPDSAAHMSEELRDASRTLPLAMVWTALVNGAMGWIAIITLCLYIGDIETVLSSPTGYPFIQVIYNVTGSKAGTSTLVAIIVVVLCFGCVTNFATSSRQMWAFARDHGFPFSSFMAKVHPKLEIPLNAIFVSYVFAMIISCINFGSAVAFNVVTSLASGALLCSYIVSISCLVARRLNGRPLLPRRFDLGVWGLPLNVFSIAYLSLVFVLTFFPQSPRKQTTYSPHIICPLLTFLQQSISQPRPSTGISSFSLLCFSSPLPTISSRDARSTLALWSRCVLFCKEMLFGILSTELARSGLISFPSIPIVNRAAESFVIDIPVFTLYLIL